MVSTHCAHALAGASIVCTLWGLGLGLGLGPAETVGQVGHLPYHFLVVHTGNDASMILIQDSELG